MDKQNKKYLKILLITQLIIGIIMFGVMVFLSKSISKHNNNTFRMIAITDTQEYMKEIVDNTIVKIELRRKETEKQVRELLSYSISDIQETEEFDGNNFLQKIGNLEYGEAIQIGVLDGAYRGTIFSNNSGVIDENLLEEKKQWELLKRDSLVWNEIEKNGNKIVLFLQQQKIDHIVKAKIYEEIHALKFTQNEYIWVNEILNYEGGEKYAIRAIHPNLADTEGEYLSTTTQDMEGNYPYLKELEGIKDKGEIFQTYYFKNKSDDKIAEKISYAKLYQPFQWIIATGKPMDNIFVYTNQLNKYDTSIIHTTMFICLLIAAILFLGGIKVIIKTQKKYKKHIDTFVKSETELDPLTGALSRRNIDQILSNQFALYQQTKESPLFIMMDIDNFKKVNDTYGHDIGDLVLRKIAETINAMIQSDDKLFRWGGEEFLLLCKDIRENEQNQFAEKILSNVNNIIFEAEEANFRVTLSMGGSYLECEDLDCYSSIKRADKSLYEAKATGKNKYCNKQQLEMRCADEI